MNKKYRDRALAHLLHTNASFVYVSAKETLCSDIRGIGRLLTLVEEGSSLANGFVADRIVGKAAALLIVHLGAKQVYADTLSRAGFEVFVRHGVTFTFCRLVPHIINRTGDGLCPMEQATLSVDDPAMAYPILKETTVRLQQAARQREKEK